MNLHNEYFWTRRIESDYFDSPLLRDYICAQGCAAAGLGLVDSSECFGGIHPHHDPEVSNGGDDYSPVLGLFATHHRTCHGPANALSEALHERAEILRKMYWTGFMEFLKACDGKAPPATRGKRTSKRVNRLPFSKPFIPISDRK